MKLFTHLHIELLFLLCAMVGEAVVGSVNMGSGIHSIDSCTTPVIAESNSNHTYSWSLMLVAGPLIIAIFLLITSFMQTQEPHLQLFSFSQHLIWLVTS